MKKNIIMVVIIWIAFIGLVLGYSTDTESDKSFMIEINRVHMAAARMFTNGQSINPDNASLIESIEFVNIKHLTSEDANTFFSGADIKENRFIILPVDGTDYFVRYTMKSVRASNLYLIIIFSVLPIMVLFMLFKIQRDILMPLKQMSVIPEQLAKGNLTNNTLQIKNKIFHKFLWGLDMLRAKLDEQKDINLRLEKDRKTLVASLSHDIKTPLSSIKTYGAAIKDGVYSTQDEIQNSVDIILEKTIKIERLTDELLASSVNAVEEITVDISGHYLNELFQVVDKTVRNRINLLKMYYYIEPNKNDCIVSVDIDRFIEVCDNITENAVKYGDLEKLSVYFNDEENYTLISFENTGNQIPELELKHVFSGFYRGSNVGRTQGHGLGLYIAKKIMRAMGGDIYVENMEGGVKIVLIVKHLR